MNTATLSIAIEVDDKGSVKLRQLGQEGKKAGETGEKATKGWRDQLGGLKGDTDLSISSLKTMAGVSFAALAAGVTAVTGVVAAMVTAAARSAKETENMARMARLSVGELQALSYATEQYGINQEQLADISKDVQDKLGDFIANEGGEFADFWDNVAPKVNLTAAKLQNLSGPDVLIAVKDAMDAANVSAEEQIFYLEALGNDASKLAPLLANNGELLHQQANRAKELGLALSEIEADQLLEADRATRELGASLTGLKNRVVAGLSPVITDIADRLTESLSDSQSEISKFVQTITDNKDTISNAFSGIITGAGNLLQIIANIGQSMAGWEAVGDGRLSFFKFATMDAEELGSWLQRDKAGIVALEAELDAVRTKITDTQQSWGLWSTKKAAIAELRAEESRLVAAIADEEQALLASAGAAKTAAAEKSAAVAATTNAVVAAHQQATKLSKTEIDAAVTAASTVTDAWLTAATEREAAAQRAIDAEDQRITDQLALETILAGEIKQLTSTTSEYKIWLLDQEVEKMQEVAGDDRDIQDQIARYRKLKLKEIEAANSATLSMMTKGWQDFASVARHEFSSNLADVITGDIRSMSEFWSSTLDGMRAKFAEVVANMAVDFAASQVTKLMGWAMAEYFHSGLWDLKDDEVPSILQKGEMVIPATYAERIRDNLGGNGPDNWEGILDATSNYGASEWGADEKDPVAGNLKDRYGSLAKAGLVGVLTGSVTPLDFVQGMLSPGFAVDSIIGAMTDAAVSPMSPEVTTQSNIGNTIGSTLSMASLAGAGMFGPGGAAVGVLGGIVGGWVGDLLGDALDMRSIDGVGVEAILDAFEEGKLTAEQRSQAIASLQEKVSMHEDMAQINSMAGTNTLGGMLDALGGYASSIGSWVAETIGSWTPSYDPAGYGDIADAIGLAESQSVPDAVSGTYDPGGAGEGMGSGGGTSSPGDLGDNDAGEGAAQGYAGGGVVNRLMVPHGDDGFAALSFSEGVIPEDTMEILGQAIRMAASGNSGGSSALLGAITDLNDTLQQVLISTRKSATLAKQWTKAGLKVVTA